MRKHFIAFAAAAALVCAASGALLSGCGEKASSEQFYLSLASESWKTYSEVEAVPQDRLFTKQSSGNFTLSVSLSEGEELYVNEIGSEEKIGYSAIFSSAHDLLPGDDDKISVVTPGQFAFTLDLSDSPVLTYVCTPEVHSDEVQSVAITHSLTAMTVGDVERFTASVTLESGAQGSGAVWSSSAPEVATVSSDGTVSAISAGTAVISATVGEKSDSVTVTVSAAQPQNVPVASVSVSPETLTLEMGESKQLTATVLPENAANKAVLWDAKDKAVATVNSEGLVTAVGFGTTDVTVTTLSGSRVATCKVSVRQPVKGIFMRSNLSVLVGSSETVNLSVVPFDATDKSVTFEVISGEEFASVSNTDGVLTVTGKATGVAKVQATSVDNPEASCTCTVTVRPESTVLCQLSDEFLTVDVGGSATFSAKLSGAEIVSAAVRSYDNSIATVQPNQVSADKHEASFTVTGAACGTASVSATVTTATDTYTFSCRVTVTHPYFYVSGSGSVKGAKEWDSGLTREEAFAANRLLTETDRGVYSLTRHYDAGDAFQIIFPDLDEEWTTAVTAEYYTGGSTYFGLTSDGLNVLTNYAGVYELTLNINGATPEFDIVPVSIDITDLSVGLAANSPSVLERGKVEETKLQVRISPTYAVVTPADIEWYTDTFYSTWLMLKPSADRRSCTVILDYTDPGTTSVVIPVYCKVRDEVASFSVGVLPRGAQEVEVTAVVFAQERYLVNVALGSWSTVIHASTDDAATSKAVTYSAVSGGISVDSNTGAVSATALGTYEVKATAVGYPSVSATCTVVFNSSAIYLAGILLGEDYWRGDPARYSFTQVDDVTYTLDHAYFQSGDGFKIIYTGMDSAWSRHLSVTHAGQLPGGISWGEDYKFQVNTAGYYSIKIDLSTSSYKVTLDKSTAPPAAPSAGQAALLPSEALPAESRREA